MENDKDEHLKLIQQLKDLSIKCFKFCKNKLPDPPVQDDDPIPSTSGYNNIVNTNKTVDDYDDEDFGTENIDHLNSELQVEVIDSGASYDTLPDICGLHVDSSDIEKDVTTFRALNAHEIKQRKKKSRKGKFYKYEDEDDTTLTDSSAENF